MFACSAPLVPFKDFELLAEDRDTSHFAGGPLAATPEMFVDLQPPKAGITSFNQLADHISAVKNRCDALRAKTSVR